jgi:FkbM family methyltransferase
MELLKRVRPHKCSFDLDVPARNALWYADHGYEAHSTAIFRSACAVADVVIDIGAHVGYYSCLAASVRPEARVIAIEASPENGLLVSSNATLNGFNVELHNAAFSNSSGRIKFEITEASDNCGLTGHPNSPTVSVIDIAAITGDDLAVTPNQKLVVKIDIEGHELSALQGIEQVLSEANDVRILLEFNVKCILLAGQSPSAILKWIWDHGYRIFALDEQAHWWSEVTELSFAEQMGSGYVNLWCVPSVSALTVSAVMHTANLGGVERSHIEVVEDLIAAGCMVQTILPMPDLGLGQLLRDAGSSVTFVPGNIWWAVPRNYHDQKAAQNTWQANIISEDLIKAIKLVDPDVVLTQSIVSPQGALAALALEKPHVWWIREFADLDHNLQLPLTPTETGKLIASLSNQVLTNSAAVRDYFFPSTPEMACVVHPIPRLVTGNSVRRNLNRPWTMGIVASFNPGKGHADAFAALVSLAKEGFDIHLACIGSGSFEDTKRLKDLASDLGIAEMVTFSGQITDRASIYELIDAVVITSRSEAFGRVAFEATDAGLPIIYPLSGGIVEYMVTNETGLAYTPSDVSSLTSAIKQLATNREIGNGLVKAAQSHFHQFRNDPNRVSLLVDQLRAARTGKAVEARNSLSFWLAKNILHSNASRAERDLILAATNSERDQAVVEAMAIRDSAVVERTAAVAERDSAVAERDSAVAERDSAVAERDSAVAERDFISNSTIWRAFGPYRKLIRFIRRI